MMTRGGFLRRLLAAPAGIAVANVPGDDAPEERRDVLSMHSHNSSATMWVSGARGDQEGPHTKLVWCHDNDGNWYLENTATGRVTRL